MVRHMRQWSMTRQYRSTTGVINATYCVSYGVKYRACTHLLNNKIISVYFMHTICLFPHRVNVYWDEFIVFN